MMLDRVRSVAARIAAGVMLTLCSGTIAHAQEVIPDFYRDPGIYPNRSYVNQSFNEHIDPFTGALQHHYVDLFLPGNGGFDIKVVRSYNSSLVDPTNPSAFESQLGLGWTLHFGRVLKSRNTTVCINTNGNTTTDNPVLELQDGSRQLLAFTGGTSPLMLSTQRWRVDCITAGAGGVAVYSPDGTRYDMTQLVNVGTGVAPVYAWYTTRITDRNGNFATISYLNSSSPQVTSLSANDGRSVSFGYAGSGTLAARITSVSSAGQTYTYGYTAVSGLVDKYYLTSVTRPDSRTWGYAYNGSLTGGGSYVMRTATYPHGGTITYGYDFVFFDSQSNPSSRATVVTTKSLSSGGSWSFNYFPGSPGNYDTTTASTPSGTITYRHIGPNYSSSGTVWMVGLLASKTIGSAQSETYNWGKQKISSENFARPGAFVLKVDVGETNAAILTSRTIARNGATHSTNYSSFDSYGNPGTISESGPNGGSRTTSVTYFVDTAKWIINRVRNESFSGSSTTRSFDGNGNLTSIGRDGVTTGYGYDGQGNITSTTFPRNLTHTYSNYKRGIPQTENQPESIAVTRVVSDAGNVTSETNGDNFTTSYSYDGLNRLIGIGYPTGNPVSISYTATTKTATRGALSETTTYNGFGYVLGTALGGIARNYSVDALGRRTFESNPGAVIGTSFEYDILDRVTRTTYADGAFVSTAFGAGTKTVTDERSRSTTYTYRSYGDPDQTFLMGIAAPEPSASVTIGRNSKDLINSVTQAGKTRGYGYNGNYYLTTVTNPETGTTTYGRDAAGNMTSRQVGFSATTGFVYDGQNRLTNINYPAGTPSIVNGYNKRSKLTSANASTGNRSFSYDANGNLFSETVLVDGVSGGLIYGYNANDQLSSVAYPSGNVVQYAPDVLGRPTQVSGIASNVQYWPSGQIRQIDYANGTITSYGQNARLWPASFTTQRGGSLYMNSSYGYDGAGNLTLISDSVDPSYNRGMGYDGINRLTSTTGPWASGVITYDGGGNLLSKAVGYQLNYGYDAANRLTSLSGDISSPISYDTYGNIIAAVGRTFTFDDAPNLRCVNCANAAIKVEFTYDGSNRRISATRAGAKTYEIFDSRDNLVVEYVAASGKLTEYIYLGGRRIAQRVTP